MITMYTNENCPYCKQVKEELEKQNIEFLNKLTSEHTADWQEIVNLTGMPTVPTIKYNDEYFIAGRDFGGPQQLVTMLNSYTDSPHDQSKRIFERMKTLNYNIIMAFNRMDGILRQIETKLNTEENVDKSTD